MHCPKCGQQQISEETRFCSKCGFLLTGIAEVVSNAGILPQISPTNLANSTSPRKRGLKQGLFIFLLTFLIVPIIAMITVAKDAEPYALAISAILLTVGGLLRMAYALMFESAYPDENKIERNVVAPPSQGFLGRQAVPDQLPSQQSIPVSDYVSPSAGLWRDTNELQEVGSVTDNTTKLLQTEKDSQ